MALTVTKIGGASVSASPLGSGSFAAPNAGDLLICIASTGNNDGTQQVTSVTDSASGTWTEISAGAGSQHDVKWWYKVSNGTETSVSVTYSTSTGNDMLVLKVTGWVNTPTLEDFDEFEGNIETADADGSVACGSVTNTTAAALVVAFIVSDGLATMDGSNAMSDGSSYTASGDQGTQIYAFHREVSSTGTYSPVYTYTDTGDQVYAASAVFGDVLSGGTTVAVPKASLVLTGYAPTVTASNHITVSVPKGSLVLSGYAPTVTVSSGTTVFVPKASLTLTGYAPTVLTPQVVQVPKGGLVLTGYAPDVLTPVTVLVPKGTLTITGYAPTIVVTSNKLIEVPKGTLVLRGYAPTVLGTVVAATNRGSYSEPDRKLRERLRRLAIQQAHIEDDEEALAILLATLMREYR